MPWMMGDFGPGDPDLGDRDRGTQAWQYSEHKACPLCGALITNDSQTCKKCRETFKAMGGDLSNPDATKKMMEQHHRYQEMLDTGATIADVIADIRKRRKRRRAHKLIREFWEATD